MLLSKASRAGNTALPTVSLKRIRGWVEGGYDASPLPFRTVRARFRAYGSRCS